MLRQLLDKGKCALGYHVEDWRDAGPGTCRQTSRCARCGVVSERDVHRWPEWERAEDTSCTLTRTCERCGRQEEKLDHAWDRWAYVADEQCGQRVFCARCGVAGEATRVAHDRGAPQWSEFYGTNVSVCRRCGDMTFATADGHEQPVSFQVADAAVVHVVGASSLTELRDRIAARSTILFSPVADHAFRFAADQRASDEDERQVYVNAAAVVRRCRDQGIATVFANADAGTGAASATPAAQAQRQAPAPAPAARPSPRTGDARLVGHWRHTESLSSGGLTMVTDTHLMLDTAGRFAWWSHRASAALGSSQSEREYGAWSCEGAVLSLRFDDGATLTRHCHVEGDHMLMPEETRYRLWERVG